MKSINVGNGRLRCGVVDVYRNADGIRLDVTRDDEDNSIPSKLTPDQAMEIAAALVTVAAEQDRVDLETMEAF